MKRSYIKIIIIELLSLIALISCLLLTKELNLSLILIILAITLILIILAVGYEPNNQVYQKDMIMSTVILLIIYYLIIYLLGIRIGFIKSIYSHTILALLKNIVPLSIILIFIELIRYEIITKGSKNKIIVTLSIIIFVLLDIILVSNKYDVFQLEDIFQIIMLVALPSIFKNSYLSYITYKLGYKVPIIYVLTKTIPIYIIPIYPDLGVYLEAILDIFLSTTLFLIIFNSLSKKKRIELKDIRLNYIYVPVIVLLSVIVLLNSGLFTYSSITVATTSMQPKINRGDIIISKKLSKKNIIEVGDVIVYKSGNNQLIVHRVVKIKDKNHYYTKGDNNNTIDQDIVSKNNVIGKAKVKIPLLGMPTIWIKEAFK